MDSIKLFDLTNLNEMLGGDKKAILQMVKIFLQATPDSLSELNKCYQKNDLQGVSKLAHKLKSSVDIFSVTEIKQDIRRLEIITRDNVSIDEVPQLVENINTILDQTLSQVEDEKDKLNKMLYQNEKASE